MRDVRVILPLGDAVWFSESNNSGILYGDPLQVNTNYRVDICAAGNFYVCNQAQSWQATAIRGIGGRENMWLGTLDTSSSA